LTVIIVKFFQLNYFGYDSLIVLHLLTPIIYIKSKYNLQSTIKGDYGLIKDRYTFL
jgi:hypothetical protein